MKQLIIFAGTLFLWSCSNDAEWQAKLQDMENQLNETKGQLTEAQENTAAPGMIHSVFFWLDEGLSDEEEADFLEGVKSLKAISHIKSTYIGPPAPTEERGVVDNSYSYALIVHFKDVEAQNAYQVDPIHKKFIDNHKDKWTKVVVYDNDVKY